MNIYVIISVQDIFNNIKCLISWTSRFLTWENPASYVGFGLWNNSNFLFIFAAVAIDEQSSRDGLGGPLIKSQVLFADEYNLQTLELVL